VRVTTLLNKLLELSGITVTGVSIRERKMLVDVRLRARKMTCPRCGYTTRARYDTRPTPSCWRHLDFGTYLVVVRAPLRRVDCPTHGVLVQAVPFARYRAGFTRDFEDLTAFLTTRTDKTTLARFLRLDWDTIGRICERVAASELDHNRLDGLVNIGVDEISWRKHHQYLTLITDHTAKKVIWGTPGKDTAACDEFFTDLGQKRAEQLQAVSMDMGPAYAKSVRTKAPNATICYDPFHAVKLVTDALDAVRRATWNDLRKLPDKDAAKKFKGARWVLLKRPDTLNDEQSATLRKLRRRGGELWRAYSLKEAFRAIFAGDLDSDQAATMLDRWLSKASRCRIDAFVKAARTIRKHRDGILAAIRLGINNARAEGLNSVVRLIIRRARGFHTAEAALALVMLSCGPINLQLPYERANIRSG
jgi:transposase